MVHTPHASPSAASIRTEAAHPRRCPSHLAAKWLQEAEKLAGLEKLDGSLWHSYRRKWATERKHLPDADVAAAGGWTNSNTLRLVYQQADQETMLRVVLVSCPRDSCT